MSTKQQAMTIGVTATTVFVLCMGSFLVVGKNAPPGGPAATQAPPPILLPTAELRQAHVHGCIARLDAMAQTSLQGTNGYRAVSTWNNKGPDDHLSSIVLGERYADGVGLTTLIASPSTGAQQCDGAYVQLVPTAHSCEEIAQSMLAANSRIVGNLVGVPLLQNSRGNQVALMPAAANSCVVVSTRVAYAD